MKEVNTMNGNTNFRAETVETIEKKITEVLGYMGKESTAENDKYESETIRNLLSARASLRAEAVMYEEKA